MTEKIKKIYPVKSANNAKQFNGVNPVKSVNGAKQFNGAGVKLFNRVYLDYAATTPVDPQVLKTMLPYFSKKFGNTMSLHSFGQEAKQALEESRTTVAKFINAKPQEIIFTGSATESNNLVLKGIALANKNKGNHIIISQIEHDCILESAKWLEKQGFEITRLAVDKYGLVNPEDVKKAIVKNTILVSIMHANNEIGTIQPIAEIGEAIKRKSEILNLKSKIYFHTDAAQSFGKIPIDVNKMNVDLLTVSSHKMYGPKGAACLFIREEIYPVKSAKGGAKQFNRVKIEPILHGGGHENGLRSSTINLPAIVGFSEAVKICQKEMTKEGQRLTKLRDKLIKNVLDKIPGSHLNGPPPLKLPPSSFGLRRTSRRASHPIKRLPNNVNFWFKGVEGESIVIHLDLMGIAASTGSACSSATLEPSHVLLAIGLKPEQAHGSLRLSLGRWTIEKEINYVLKILPGIIKNLRKISPFK